MKVKFHMWCLALLFALSTFAIPVAAQAGHWCYGGCGYGGGGIIYNQTDGRWYHIPTTSNRNIVYRVVDDKYVPVAKYGYYCHRYHHHRYSCYRHVAVVCTCRPAHWFVGVWYPDSTECYYKLVR